MVNGLFALWFLFALGKGITHIRANRMALHREWMIRAFAIGLGIATMRLIFIPALIAAGEPDHQQIATLSIVSFTIAFVGHAIFAEVWIRRTRAGETA
jgi:hypothetical protein